MDTGVVNTGVHEIGQYGPGWLLGFFILVALVGIIMAIVPSIKKLLDQKADAKAAEVVRNDEREHRKQKEYKERSERDGQMIQLISDSNKIIERNNQAFRQMMLQFDKADERNVTIINALSDVDDSIKNMEHAVSDLRIDVAKDNK